MATREQTPKALPGGLGDVATAHPWSYAASLLLVAVAYYAAAKLNLRLALVGRNITPFWPPTGIAVVAFILLGRSVWPGHGEINLSNAHEVASAIGIAMGQEARGLVVDLSDITYLDSAGVALLLRLAERLRSRRRQLHLVVPRGSPVRRVLDFTGLPRVIPLDARLEDALARCACGRPDNLT